MSQNSSYLSLPFIQPAQAQKHVTHNEAIARLDEITQLAVLTDDQTTPPTAQENDRHIVPAGASGAWTGHEGKIARWDGSAWVFLDPGMHWTCFVETRDVHVVYNGTTWAPVAAPTQADQFGINATADEINRLAVRSPAVLFNHDGAGTQVKVNRATTNDSATVLFQNDFVGSAEFGLAAGGEFEVKVSDDGSSWQTAMQTVASTGYVHFPQGAEINGSLTGSAIFGTVTPTGGALIEANENTNGRYVRYADGTQICTHTVDITYNNAARMIGAWTFPIPFLAGSMVSVSFSLENEYAATPGPQDFAFIGARDGGSGQHEFSSLRVYRSSNGSSFQAGDILVAHAHAIGRWK